MTRIDEIPLAPGPAGFLLEREIPVPQPRNDAVSITVDAGSEWNAAAAAMSPLIAQIFQDSFDQFKQVIVFPLTLDHLLRATKGLDSGPAEQIIDLLNGRIRATETLFDGIEQELPPFGPDRQIPAARF